MQPQSTPNGCGPVAGVLLPDLWSFKLLGMKRGNRRSPPRSRKKWNPPPPWALCQTPRPLGGGVGYSEQPSKCWRHRELSLDGDLTGKARPHRRFALRAEDCCRLGLDPSNVLVPHPPPTEKRKRWANTAALVDLRDPYQEGLVEIFVLGERSIDAAGCQESCPFAGLCPMPPPPPRLRTPRPHECVLESSPWPVRRCVSCASSPKERWRACCCPSRPKSAG